jgi:hypothetical protein
MDERSIDQSQQESDRGRRRRHRLVTALMVAGVLVAVPAGVALAGGSDGSAASDGGSAGTVPVQSTTPEDGQRDRGQGDHDCPERDGQGGQESTEL